MRSSIVHHPSTTAGNNTVLAAMINAIPDAVIATDQEGIVLALNPAAQKLLSLHDKSLAGTSVCDLVASSSGKRLSAIGRWVSRTGEPTTRFLQITLPCGHILQLELTLSPMTSDSGEAYGFSALVRSHTHNSGTTPLIAHRLRSVLNHEPTEEKLRQSEKRFRSIIENSADGFVILSEEGRPTYLSPSIRTILGYEEEEALQMNLFNTAHPDDIESLTRLWAKVLANPALPIRAYPCRILHKDGTYRIFDGTFTNLLHDPSIRGIVDNFRDVTDMVVAENKIRESETHYRYLFFNNPGPMWIFDQDTLRFLAVNEAAIQQYGYSEKEFLNLSVLDIRPAHHAERFREAVQRRTGTTYNKVGEFEHLTKKGETIYVDIVSHLITYEGKNAMLVLAKDITEQKKANQLLMKSYIENNKILESIGDGFFSVDANFKIVYWNKAAEKIAGVPRAQVLGKSLLEHFSSAMSLKFFREYKRAMEENVSVSFEEYYPDNDLWVDVTAYPSPDGLSVFFRDITAKKKAVDVIRKANEKFNTIARISNDAIYEWDILKNVLYWNEGYASLFGHEWTAGAMPVESWRDNVHPNDRTALMKFAQESFRQRIPNIKRELRFRCADGSYKLLDDKLAIIYDEAGNPLKLVGCMQDITEKRAMETSLQNTRNRQQRALTRASIQGQEKEREQIGVELHDNINQILATASLYIEHGLSMETIQADIISQGKDMIQLATREIRKLSHALLPPAAGDFALIAALTDLAASFNFAEKFQVQVDFAGFDESNLPRENKLTIYRIAQEQLNNILKHAACQNVMITLSKTGDEDKTELVIADDGKGFDLRQKKNGVGLRNIVSRAELLCGQVGIETSPGKGCRMTVLIPSKGGTGEDCVAK